MKPAIKCICRPFVIGIIWTTLALAGCDSRPDDPYERFLFDFEQKVDTLFEHMENADEVMTGNLSVSMDRSAASSKSEFYRYKYIGPAAVSVYQHFSSPEMTFYMAMATSEEVEPAWREALTDGVATHRVELAEHIRRFTRDMPREPEEPAQSAGLSREFGGTCGRGGLYSGSEFCLRGLYGYDENDRLYFHVEGGVIFLDQLLSLDVDDWLRAVRTPDKRTPAR